jgi:hypothetical protein
MLSCSQPLAPLASCSPHHHIVSWTFPFGMPLPVGNSGLPACAPPLPSSLSDELPHAATPSAQSAARSAATSRHRCVWNTCINPFLVLTRARR